MRSYTPALIIYSNDVYIYVTGGEKSRVGVVVDVQRVTFSNMPCPYHAVFERTIA